MSAIPANVADSRIDACNCSSVFTTSADAACPVCGQHGGQFFFTAPRVPVFCNVLWKTPDQAAAAPTGSIRLARCRSCQLIFNAAFNPELIAYAPGYENSLHFSPAFQRYAAQLAHDLVERYDLRQKTIIDIGCGQGDFLRLLCETGNNQGVGYDPSFDAERSGILPESVSILRTLFSRECQPPEAALICCRHVLEHINDPAAFLGCVRDAAARRSGTVVFFEVPHALWAFQRGGIWDIIYEHCLYFTAASLVHLFQQAGFEVLRTDTTYADQFLTIEARVATIGTTQLAPISASASDDLEAVTAAFALHHEQTVRAWRSALRTLAERGERIAIWGAGSKGVTFLNMLGVGYDIVPWAVDINPHKHNRYVAGTSQRVLGLDDLAHSKPTVIVLMNPVYREEVMCTLSRLKLSARLIGVDEFPPCPSNAPSLHDRHLL